MSNRDLKQSVTVDLEGNLPRRSKAYEKAIERMAKRGEAHMGRLNRVTRLAGRGLDRIGNRYAALLSGAAVGLAIRQVGDLQERYTRLGQAADISDSKIAQLKQTIFETSQAADIRTDPGEILSAVEAILEKTGDLGFAEQSIRNIGLAMQATGAAGADIGELMAEIQKQGIKAPQAVLKVIDTFNQQGKEGAFTLREFARLGPRVVSAYGAAGHSGIQSMREMGAVLQVIRQGTGSSQQAATAFEAMIRTLTDPQKIKQLKELGNVDVFGGDGKIKPIHELMVEIIKASKGKVTNLGQIFDAEAMRAFNAPLAEFNRTGGVASLERFYQVTGDGAATLRDAARGAKTFNASWERMTTSFERYADENLAGPMEGLADLLDSMDQSTVNIGLNTAKWAGYLLGAMVAGRKLYKGWKAISELTSKNAGLGGKGAAGGLGKAASMAKPVPVFVVNMGPGGLTGGGRSGKAKMLGLGGSAALGSSAFGVAGAGLAGWEVGSLISDMIDGTRFQHELGKGIAHNMEALSKQDKAGIAMTAFGGPFGAFLAHMRKMLEVSQRDEAVRSREVEGTVRLEIDSQAPVRVRELRADGLDLDVDAGQTMWGP